MTGAAGQSAEATAPTGAEPSSEDVVAVRDLWFAYRGASPVLRGVDLVAKRGSITMVLGASGSGKTTLLKLIKGFIRPQRGSLQVLDRRWDAAGRVPRLSPDVGYIPQNLGLIRNLSVLENVLMGSLGRMGTIPSLLRLFPPAMVQDAEGVLERLGLASKVHMKVHTLSGGERQRVAIARARLQQASLVLADEFVSQLDPVTTTEVMDILKNRARTSGTTYLQTTHQLDVVERFADHVVVLREGHQVLDAPAAGLNMAEISRIIKL